jgi:hypothetical protein
MSADELLAYVTADEPPMALTADRLLTLGRRRHRLRLLSAIGGGGGAIAVALGVLVAQLPGTPAPQFATPQAACLREVPIDAAAPGDVVGDPNNPLDPTASAAPELVPPTEEQLTAVSCAAVRGVLGLVHGKTFFPHGYRGQAAFQATWFPYGGMIMAQGRAIGGGAVSVSVSAQKANEHPPTQEQLRTDEPWKSMDHVQLDNLPDGAAVLTYTAQLPLGESVGAHRNFVTVWTGHTIVTATSDNLRSVRPADAGGPPLLSLDQVRQLALDPAFAVFG